jgi:hypothetical protein
MSEVGWSQQVLGDGCEVASAGALWRKVVRGWRLVSVVNFRISSIGVGAMSSLYVARSSEIAARQLGDELIVMSARDSTLFSLNDVGLVIWQAADGRTPLEDIVKEKVCAEFEIAPEEALKDAESFVRELAGHGILILSDTPMAGGQESSG